MNNPTALERQAISATPSLGKGSGLPRQRRIPKLKTGAMSTPVLSSATASALVATGGAAGAVLRYQAGRAVSAIAGAENTFPWATLCVNLLGSLLMGALLGWLARTSLSSQTAETMRLLFGVGLLGGFTTFSTFSAELVTLLQRGQAGWALGYAAGSLLAGVAALAVGLIAVQSAP
jgi:CrcB protein